MQNRQLIINGLRALSNDLESADTDTDDFYVFPGWDTEFCSDASHARGTQIRNAARAILADGDSFDDGNAVPYADVAALIHYLADMLER